MFDPHTKSVPGANYNQPGVKISFAPESKTDQPLSLQQFDDQIAPCV